MAINVYRHIRDLAILWRGQQSDTDTRVPTAEELAATEEVLRGHVAASRQVKPLGLTRRPTLTGAATSITIAGAALWSHQHPTLTTLPTLAIALPPLGTGAINRYDYVYLVAMAVQVGAAQDANVNLSFQWRSGTVLQTVVRENTARLRSAYGLWVSQGEMTPQAIATAIGSSITVNASAPTVYGTSRLYWVDDALTSGLTYSLSGTPEVISLCRVWRLQNTTVNGYAWGAESLDSDIHVQPNYQYVGDGWDNWQARTQETIYRIMGGRGVQNSPAFNRHVVNLVNGQVGANALAPGVAGVSPNSSALLANEQRITFTNQAITQTVNAVLVTTTNDGTGKAVATLAIASNSPSGTVFAASGHSIINTSGTDITAQGAFTGTGTGALTWTASVTGVPTVGSQVYLVPDINYPAGSGLPVCGAIERVYLGSAVLNAANVRETDITAYTNPASAESYIVVMNRANAAIQWIYRKFTVTSSGSGVVTLPTAARGLIAWISGTNAPTSRQDRAVITGLANNSEYNLLCYHAPPATEQWQFQLRAPAYAGTKDITHLNGSQVITAPLTFAHSLGGGTTFNPPSRPLPDGLVNNSCVAWQLPKTDELASIRDFALDAEMAFESAGIFNRLAPFLAIPMVSPDAGRPSLQPGLALSATALASIYTQSLSASLSGNDMALGLSKVFILNNKRYQLVVACGIEKAGDRRVLVLTCNEGTPSANNSFAVSSDTPSFIGIDTFRYY